jgi:acetolactate decarboxylase
MKMLPRILLAVALVCCLSGCSGVTGNRITQTSTIDALLSGAYDGDMACKKLLQYGDFGIGTFDKLDGEMVLINGKIYQVKADGNIYKPDLDLKTPFATVCKFQPDLTITLQSGLDYTAVGIVINNLISDQNTFAAVKISGVFKRMKVRSVPEQKKPYPPLIMVTKNQPEFVLNDVKGTIIGFRSPDFVKGINVPGFHFHFISAKLNQGGHVLDFELMSGICKIDICNEYLLILPGGIKSLKDIDLSKDRSAELEKVEK